MNIKLTRLANFPGACKDCGSKVQVITIFNQHSSGEWNESVEYKCGAKFSFCPNFPNVNSRRDEICQAELPACEHCGARKARRNSKFCCDSCAINRAEAND
jgi:hypothetical protein